MKYIITRKRHSKRDLDTLKEFYRKHGLRPCLLEWLESPKPSPNYKKRIPIDWQFKIIIEQLNNEKCKTLIPHGIGVSNRITFGGAPK